MIVAASKDSSSRSNVPASAASLLVGLNPAQLKAVQYAPEFPIQILAGPGSGKTKVLTSRIGYLILHHSIPPSSICAVTFTNKAANEMRERLTKLIGKRRTEELKMGTFHALCARFLRIHATLVGLDTNFTICDADESKKIIASSLKKQKEYLEDKNLSLTEGTVLSMISKAKAKGQTAIDILSRVRIACKEPHGLPRSIEKTGPLSDIEYIVGVIYDEYERILRRNNALDFDDLLLYGVKLFAAYEHTVSWCRYVLVDEFQDTNTTQYDLMVYLARHKRVTVVGDPDQSIYGWRSAEVTNLAKMCKDFNGTQKILLEENYRSTASILAASLAIVAQDKTRIQKYLHTSHPAGSTPFLRAFVTEHAEAQFIAIEIKRLIAHMGGVLRWGDFAILLRFNALSRTIESALQKNGIPSKVLGGHKFFERQEIKNVLAYLQLVDNPSFNPALVRAANVPSRGIGEKTLQEIAARAEKSGVSQLTIMEGICDGRLPDIKPTARRKLTPFVKAIRTLRDLADKGTSPADLIRRLLDLVEFENHLRKTQPDWESRWENVKELITFASEVETNIIAVEEGPSPDTEADASTSKDTPLRLFLQASMLSSAGDNQSEEDSKDKVTISTCHAAKGLEWPVVMVPSTEQGTFPFARSEDVEEERRLLYVACTRAQGLLYLSYSESRNIAGITKDRTVSEFISVVMHEDPTLFTGLQPTFLPVDRRIICDILNRILPPDSEVSRRVAEFEKTNQHHRMDEYRPETVASSHSSVQELPAEMTATFTASSAMLRNPGNNIAKIFTRPVQHPTALSVTSNTHASRPSTGNVTTMFSPAQRSTHPSSSMPTSTTIPPRHPATTTLTLPSQHTNTRMSAFAQPAQMHPLLMPNTSLPSRENVRLSLPRAHPVAPPIPKTTLNTPQISTYNEPVSDVPNQGTKRRLGMGRGGGGYSNKKFKPPT
ncbi:P-loop containing nucleoside triphosphate hydrolase protein [Lyophyllum atratum]|nr:P-loop containing nucleoside triphosphate hydrolase protein [Lyophyllum atratum]